MAGNSEIIDSRQDWIESRKLSGISIRPEHVDPSQVEKVAKELDFAKRACAEIFSIPVEAILPPVPPAPMLWSGGKVIKRSWHTWLSGAERRLW